MRLTILITILILSFWIFFGGFGMQKNLSLEEKFRFAKLHHPQIVKEMQNFKNSSYFWAGYATLSLTGAVGTKLEYLPFDSVYMSGFTVLAICGGYLSFRHKGIANECYQRLIEYTDAHIAYQNNIDDPLGNNPRYQEHQNQ